MSDLSGTAVAERPTERSIPEHVVITEKDFAVLVDLRERCEEARTRFNAAAEDAKSKRKAFEGAREIFETNFDRIVRRAKGEDLPLFNQSELLDKAQADPVVMKLVDRLIAAGFDVNAILVAGYTQDERAEASAYLDALEAGKAQHDAGEAAPVIDVPAFLLPQPLTPIELAELAQRLATIELTITTEQLAAFSKAQIAEVRDFLDRYAAVGQEKGDAVTVDDLPEPPEFLTLTDALNVEGEGEDGSDSDAESDPNEH